MIKKSPQATAAWLDTIIAAPHRISAMLWGPPGVGKSSLVAQAAQKAGLQFIQLELAVMPPQDLMGLPYVEEGESRYARPAFWPTKPGGVLLLDDFTHALPAIQSLSMSLLLMHSIGPHTLPEGWHVIGTGNRTSDGANCFKMPTPTANRMAHVEVEADVTVWREWALAHGVHEDILGLLGLRPELLHKLSRDNPAWPSPRTWAMASHLHSMELDVASAVGEGAAAELAAYVDLKAALPSLEPILVGQGDDVAWPDELSLRWALVVGLAFKANSADEVGHAFRYLSGAAGCEWQSLFLQDVTVRFRTNGRIGELAVLMTQEPALAEFVDGLLELVA
jgi:MoxR-like ATPase